MEAEMKMALQPPRDLRAETCRLVIWGLVLAMLAWAWRGAEMKPMALVEQGGNILTLISDFFPPDFTDWRHVCGRNDRHPACGDLGHLAGGHLRGAAGHHVFREYRSLVDLPAGAPPHGCGPRPSTRWSSP